MKKKPQAKDTRIHLVQELEKILHKVTPDGMQPLVGPALKEMITEAKAGEYHDYKNKKYDCGKVAVVRKLRAVGLNALADRVQEGEFDEDADDKDVEMLKGYFKK